ncbi:MAG: transglycosylase domain-containing protein [Bacteroidales bacterium]|nr:transglycosylase domain-containing protein [Candidatus Sodaliphilus aphodohippi]
MSQLRNPTDKFASTIYADGGEEMGRYYRSKGNRTFVDYSHLSPHLRNALVATEDVRFDGHSGIDIRALGRSIVKRIILGQHNAGGGSTITQQLAKQLYSPESSNIFERALQKPIEWVIAIKLERYYTKDEIVQMYFNQFDFLNNAVGIKSASTLYFGKNPSTLNIQEAATLVGMCKNPSYYNPLRHPERTRQRRNVVLEQMCKAGFISDADCSSLQQTPLSLNLNKIDSHQDVAPYFKEELRRVLMASKPDPKDYSKWNHQAYVDDSAAWENNPLFGWCNKHTKPDGSHYDIYSDGLKIYTTIDIRMQKHAEDAVYKYMAGHLQPSFERQRGGMHNPYTDNTSELSRAAKQSIINNAIKRTARYQMLKEKGMSEAEIMDNFRTPTNLTLFTYNGEIERKISPLDSILYSKSFLRCSTMAMDPKTGYVKSYVGGPNFKFFKYDMVSTGRRQIGSTIKPFVYSQAIENGGLTPCDIRPGGAPQIKWYNTVWNPRNGGGGGSMTLKQALTYSKNWITAGFMKGTSPNWIEEQGYYVMSPEDLVRWMHSFGITSYLEPVPALCLGSSEVTLREMVAAYSAFANGGMRIEPIYVSCICDNNGNVIDEFVAPQNEIMSEDTYIKMLTLLEGVVASGTGARVRSYGITAEMGGKTGTTNFSSDGWFMALTPDLVVGTWVGGEDRFIHLAGSQGADLALPIFAYFMKAVYDDPLLSYSQEARFKVPSGYDVCGNGYLDLVGNNSGSYRRIDRSNAGSADDADGAGAAIEGVFD